MRATAPPKTSARPSFSSNAAAEPGSSIVSVSTSQLGMAPAPIHLPARRLETMAVFRDGLGFESQFPDHVFKQSRQRAAKFEFTNDDSLEHREAIASLRKLPVPHERRPYLAIKRQSHRAFVFGADPRLAQVLNGANRFHPPLDNLLVKPVAGPA